MSSAFYAFIGILMSASAVISATTTSTAVTVGGVTNDENQAAKVTFNLTQVSTGTVDCRVEGSWDGGTNYITLASMTQLAAAGARAQVADITAVAPKMRVVTTLTGAATVAAGAKVLIVSTNGVNVV